MAKDNNRIRDWYKIVGAKQKDPNKDKHFKNHYILPESRILCVGQSGSGKITFLMEFLSRSGDRFYYILLFTGSTTEEPIYKFLKQKNPDIQMFNDINAFPKLTDMDATDKAEKLVVIDDFINLDKKGKTKIKQWMNSSRKYHFACVVMAQNITDVPTQVRRNVNYFAMLKLNDNNTIKHILSTYAFDVKRNTIIKMFSYSTKEPKHFFFIDCLTQDLSKRFRHNLLEFLDPNNFKEYIYISIINE